LALLPDLGEALHDAGRSHDADRVLREAIDAAAAAGDDLLRARATLPWLHLQWFVDPGWSAREVERHVAEIVPILEAAHDDRGLAGAFDMLTTVPLEQGRFDELEELERRVVVLATRAGDIRRAASTRGFLCILGLWGPTPVREAVDRCHEVLDWSRSVPGVEGCVGRVLRALGMLRAMTGQFDEAREHNRRSSEIFGNLGALGSLAASRHSGAEIEILAGRPDAAEVIMRRELAAAEPLGVAFLNGISIGLAEAVLMRGEIEEADALTLGASSLATIADREMGALWRAIRARVLAHMGRLEEAEALARDAVSVGEGTGFFVPRFSSYRALAEVLHAQGRDPESRVELARALELCQQKGDVVRVAMLGELTARFMAREV
jgi:tetratricopeptide (TPR) repeat protein